MKFPRLLRFHFTRRNDHMANSHQTVGRFVLLLPVGMQDYTVSLEISTDEPRSYPGGCKEILRAVERVLKDGTRGYWDGHVSSR